MLKKRISFTDYNGSERVENFYFNLNDSELMEMELGKTGGFLEYIDKVIGAQDVPALIHLFKDLIIKSYGVKSDDGRRFIKTPELTNEFQQTEAFSKLYLELATDSKAASDFVNGIVSKPMNDVKKMDTSKLKQYENITAMIDKAKANDELASTSQN